MVCWFSSMPSKPSVRFEFHLCYFFLLFLLNLFFFHCKLMLRSNIKFCLQCHVFELYINIASKIEGRAILKHHSDTKIVVDTTTNSAWSTTHTSITPYHIIAILKLDNQWLCYTTNATFFSEAVSKHLWKRQNLILVTTFVCTARLYNINQNQCRQN